MTGFSKIFNVFSKRPETQAKVSHSVPETTRTRVLLWCNEVYENERKDVATFTRGGDYRQDFWQEIHRFFQYKRGKLRLYSNMDNPIDDAINYLMNCEGEEFLDFLEYIFKVDCLVNVGLSEDQMVKELNELLREDNLPYYITDFVRVTEKGPIAQLGGRVHEFTRNVEAPKVIMRESEVLHEQATLPALMLLQRPEFRNANTEYLAALEDYRKNDFGDCLTKCTSSFESVLKVICQTKRWAYKETDTAGALVKIVVTNMTLDAYFEPMLMIVATLRNRLSTAHGGGTSVRQAPKHQALFALNITASAILLLTDEAG